MVYHTLSIPFGHSKWRPIQIPKWKSIIFAIFNPLKRSKFTPIENALAHSVKLTQCVTIWITF